MDRATGLPDSYRQRTEQRRFVSERPPIYDLHPPKSATFITKGSERDTLALLDKVNRAHMAERAGDSRLEAGSPPMRWRHVCS